MSDLPLSAIWLDSEAIGRMLAYDARVVAEKIASRPDFPKPSRIGNKGKPRWRADEVAAWMEQWRETV